jgi:hypothetical protein
MSLVVENCYPHPFLSMQVNVTAKDVYGNVITNGDAGFVMATPLQSSLLPRSFNRTVSAGVTSFQFRVTVASIYILRFEMATGALVHQSKFRIAPGGISHLNSRYLKLPPTFVVNTMLVATLQIRDAYGNVFVDAAAAAAFVLSAKSDDDPGRSVGVRSS